MMKCTAHSREIRDREHGTSPPPVAFEVGESRV